MGQLFFGGTMYRVYLLPEWREFGVDYPTRERAEEAADRFRASFSHRYAVRSMRHRARGAASR